MSKKSLKTKYMEQPEIANIIIKRFKKINAAFDKVRLHLMEDDIRLFHVKVKKLAACLRLINTEKNHAHSLKVPLKITRLFKTTGKIRTLQMQQKLIEKALEGKQMAAPEAYFKIISDQILHYIALANKQTKGIKPFKKQEDELLKSLPKHIRAQTVHQFIQMEGDTLAELFAPVFPADRSFHEARKVLKNLLYLSPYLELEISNLSPYAYLSSYDAIDAFTVVLGRFQDLHTAIAHLHTECLKINADESEKIVLRNLESLWMKDHSALREEIFDQLQKIISAGRAAPLPEQ